MSLKILWMRGLGCAALGGLLALSGCGFFPPNTTTSTSTGTATSGDYVYAVNPTSNTLTGYVVGTGTLTLIGNYTLPTGLISVLTPGAIAVSGTNAFVYVAGLGSIYGYSIGTGGALTALNSGSALVTANEVSLDCSPDGNWLVGLDNTTGTVGQVDIFKITASTGLLTAGTSVAPTENFTGTVVPRAIKFSPLAGYIIASLGTAGNALFTFTTSNGAITNAGGILTGSAPQNFNAAVFNTTDTTLYATSTSGSSSTLNGVQGYTVGSGGESASGALAVSGAKGADAIVLSSSGGYLYVGGTDGTISEFSFSSGTPTSLAGSPISVSYAVTSLARDNSGNYILAGFALSGSATADLALYQISNSTTGTLAGLVSASTNTSTVDTAGLLIATTH